MGRALFQPWRGLESCKEDTTPHHCSVVSATMEKPKELLETRDDMSSPVQAIKGSFLEKVILELNSKGCVGVAELKNDQQEQKLRDGTVIKIWLVIFWKDLNPFGKREGFISFQKITSF